MNTAPERLVNAQRSLIENSQNIGLKGLEGATRLFELNIQTLNQMFGQSAERSADMSSSERPYATAASSALQSDGTAFVSYARQVVEIVTSTNTEIARLMQQQAAGLQSLASEMVNATMTAPPATNEALQTMMRDPFGAMQRTFNQAAGEATRTFNQGTSDATRSANLAAQTTASAAAQAAEAATRGSRRSTPTND